MHISTVLVKVSNLPFTALLHYLDPHASMLLHNIFCLHLLCHANNGSLLPTRKIRHFVSDTIGTKNSSTLTSLFPPDVCGTMIFPIYFFRM